MKSAQLMLLSILMLALPVSVVSQSLSTVDQTVTLPGTTSTTTITTTVSGISTTYTLVAIQSGSTWTNTLGITVTQITGRTVISSTTPGETANGPLWLLLALALLIILLLLGLLLHRNKEAEIEAIRDQGEAMRSIVRHLSSPPFNLFLCMKPLFVRYFATIGAR